MNDYLTKPIDIKRLVLSLTRWLQPKTSNRNLSKAESGLVNPNVQIENKDKHADNDSHASSPRLQQLQITNTLKSDKPIEKERLIWDQDGFMKRISHNEVIGNKLLVLFMDEVPADIKLLQQAIEQKYSNDIIALAHKVKGSSRNLGADNLAHVCSEIEQMAKEKKHDKLESLREILTSNFNQFIMKIEKHVN
jgi:HPt (histidine-containing phosphotransfer) domain-containing protein